MGAGLPKFVTVNLRQLEAKFKEGDEVSLESVLEKKLFKATGKGFQIATQGLPLNSEFSS